MPVLVMSGAGLLALSLAVLVAGMVSGTAWMLNTAVALAAWALATVALATYQQRRPVAVVDAPVDQPVVVVETDSGEPAALVALPAPTEAADEVFAIAGRPRYHRATCGYLRNRTHVPISRDAAQGTGLTPCGKCRP